MVKLEDTLLEHFIKMEDFGVHNHNFRHKLVDILVISVVATICGADGWTEIHDFGVAKQEWLSAFLELPHGIPSHDTFGRVFSLLDRENFFSCFTSWINSLTVEIEKEIIALDGKTLRGSGNKRKNQKALHIVSAWAAKNRLMLGQVKTEEKSNEIKAILKLLDLVDVKDSVVKKRFLKRYYHAEQIMYYR